MDALAEFFSNLSYDWLIIAGVVLLLGLDAIRNGTNRALALALSFPIASILYDGLASTAILGDLSTQSSPLLQAIVFLGMALLMAILVLRMIDSYTDSSFLSGLLAGIAATVIIVALWVNLDALVSVWRFGSSVAGIFGEAYLLYWLVGAYAVLAFARR